jgi:serine O-acetyltransferase
MTGIPARPTLVDAAEYRKFVPYGTPCAERFDPATQQLELMKCEIEALRSRLSAFIQERDNREAEDRRESA